jgi:Ser/Thr protein kinase RdoA (MazF antagonist)
LGVAALEMDPERVPDGPLGPGSAVLAAFGLADGDAPRAALPGGHIHENYVVGSPPALVLQKLNPSVFGNVGAVADNAVRITTHLRSTGRRAPVPVFTAEGAPVHVDGSGACWRAWEYLAGTETRTAARGPEDAYAAAAAFADYAVGLADLPGGPLTVTIRGFHDLGLRLAQLDEARSRVGQVGAAADPRVADVLERVRTCGSVVLPVVRAGLAEVPVRVAHNDAKMANVRFDVPGGAVACVVDFDTTMTGTIVCDVGELLRSAGTTVAEDAPAGADVDIDLARCQAVVDGYRTGAGDALGAAEAALFPWAGPWMALENAARFLADHLGGDRYFRVTRPGQNLDRAHTQMRLAEALLARQEELRAWSSGPAR